MDGLAVVVAVLVVAAAAAVLVEGAVAAAAVVGAIAGVVRGRTAPDRIRTVESSLSAVVRVE